MAYKWPNHDPDEVVDYSVDSSRFLGDDTIINDGVTWKAPVPYPSITTYKDNGADVNYNIFWNENDLEWKALDWDSPRNTFAWDSDNLVWIQQ